MAQSIVKISLHSFQSVAHLAYYVEGQQPWPRAHVCPPPSTPPQPLIPNDNTASVHNNIAVVVRCYRWVSPISASVGPVLGSPSVVCVPVALLPFVV